MNTANQNAVYTCPYDPPAPAVTSVYDPPLPLGIQNEGASRMIGSSASLTGSLESIDSQFKSETDSELGTPCTSFKETLSSETFIARLCKTFEKAGDLPVTVSIDSDSPHVTVNQSSSPVPKDEIELLSFRKTSSPVPEDDLNSTSLIESLPSSSTLSCNMNSDESDATTVSSQSSQNFVSGDCKIKPQNDHKFQSSEPKASFLPVVNEKKVISANETDILQDIALPVSESICENNTRPHVVINSHKERYDVKNANAQMEMTNHFRKEPYKNDQKLNKGNLDSSSQIEKKVPFVEAKSKLKNSSKEFLTAFRPKPATKIVIPNHLTSQCNQKVNNKLCNENNISLHDKENRPANILTKKLDKNNETLSRNKNEIASQDKLTLLSNKNCRSIPAMQSQSVTETKVNPEEVTIKNHAKPPPVPPVRRSSISECPPPIPPRPVVFEELIPPPVPRPPDFASCCSTPTFPPMPPPRQFILIPVPTEKQHEPPPAPPRSVSLKKGTPPPPPTRSKHNTPSQTPNSTISRTPERSLAGPNVVKGRHSPSSILESVHEEVNTKPEPKIQESTENFSTTHFESLIPEDKLPDLTPHEHVGNINFANISPKNNSNESCVSKNCSNAPLSCYDPFILPPPTADKIQTQLLPDSSELSNLNSTDAMSAKESEISPPAPPPEPLAIGKTSLMSVSPYGKIVIDRTDLPILNAEDEIRKSVDAAVNWALVSPGRPIMSIYQQCSPLIQKGPQCGLVALQMASVNFGYDLELDTILQIARERDISRHGEMFSADDFADLARDLMSATEVQVCEDLLMKPNSLIDSLMKQELILVPYDAHKNHMPTKCGGHRAHWALVCGCLIQTSGGLMEEEKHKWIQDSTLPNLFHLPPQKDSKLSKNPFSISSDSKIILLWRQGKSRGLVMSPLEDLKESNFQLIEYPQSEDYIIKSVEKGLKRKCIVLSKTKC